VPNPMQSLVFTSLNGVLDHFVEPRTPLMVRLTWLIQS